MTESGRVVVIGDALVDEMRDEAGSVNAPGGSALNVAVGLAILGVPSTLIAMVGDDADGDYLRAYLSRFDVELLASASALGTGRAVSDRSAGEPRYTFNAAALARSIVYTMEMRQAISRAPLVAVSSYPLDVAAEASALTDALDGRPGVLIDPNPRDGFLADRDAFTRALDQLVESSHLIKIGDEDARLLYDLGVDEVAARFASNGAGVVLATAGAEGATVLAAGRSIRAPITADARAVVDTMGAGDATFASVIAHLIATGEAPVDWTMVLDRSMAIAAETIRHAGGQLRRP